ncbi:alpha/beta fold hydrolase [Candidatus Peregrinibacteria bacterium]|nr:alpha/beta fold hydrolase [Candidatus Peregrinibacteria bacterium]MBI3816271.1 alpha/beta fold hydrolase [Candidatus Peregrinibacteria bacterium]
MKALLLCLHGWGGSKESFTELRQALNEADIEVLTPDLPGFGAEPEPKRPWTVEDYADWVEKWLTDRFSREHLLQEQFLLLGHSHGGRIAITLAVRGRLPIDHLYLCAAAGIRRPRHLRRIIGLTLAKAGKLFLAIPGLKILQPVARTFLYRLVRVHDYERASPVMRQTLINVTAEDLRPLLPKIHLPTDIFWGMDDRMVRVKDGKLIHEKITGSRLRLYKNVRHAVHRDRAKSIADVIVHDLAREGEK